MTRTGIVMRFISSRKSVRDQDFAVASVERKDPVSAIEFVHSRIGSETVWCTTDLP
jgi:hypothetical protein